MDGQETVPFLHSEMYYGFMWESSFGVCYNVDELFEVK